MNRTVPLFCLVSALFFITCLKPLSQPLGYAAQSDETQSDADSVAPFQCKDEPIAGMGILVGEVTSTAALVQVRLTKADQLVEGDVPGEEGFVKFVLSRLDVPSKELQEYLVEVTSERDFIARVLLSNLVPGAKYSCVALVGTDADSLHLGPRATFGTLPGPEIARETRFVVVTGMNYARFYGNNFIDHNQHLGYPALESILKLEPDFFVGTGDNVYYDTPDDSRAETIPQLRQKWHEQFVQPRYRDLFAKVPTYWEIDDHDYRIDDCDNTGDYDPTPGVGRQMMLEQLPFAPYDSDDAKTYRTHRVSKDLQIWFVENRLYRSPNASEDGPKKTIWGDKQKAWLMRTLEKSDATFKLLISPTPMVGPDDLRKTDNHTDIGGFQHERDEFFAWLKKTGIADENFYLVCGDRHWQYHSISPESIEEFSCGALVDANSRLGRKPGDRKSTDPKGLIKQPYSQGTPSGGFLLVTASPAADDRRAKLTFTFHDEQGKVLHEHSKAGK